MPRTRAQFIAEFAAALGEVPISLRRLQAIAEQAFVDLHDAPASQSKLDCPLAACCDDLRVVNVCERVLGVITIEDLSKVGRDRLLNVPNMGEKGFAKIHDAVSDELGDHLLSRDLDDYELRQILPHHLVLRSDLRDRKLSWLGWTSGDLAERLINLRGNSDMEQDRSDDDPKPLSSKMEKHLARLNNRTPTEGEDDHDDF